MCVVHVRNNSHIVSRVCDREELKEFGRWQGVCVGRIKRVNMVRGERGHQVVKKEQ